MNLANTWKAYFNAMPTNAEANKNLSSFAKATKPSSATTFKSEIIQNLVEDTDAMILAIAPVTKKLKLYHSFTNLGGTRVKPDDKIIGLEGFGPTATPLLFKLDCLTNLLSIQTPTFTTLKSITDTKDVATAAVSSQAFKNATFIILPPFVALAFIDLEITEPANLLIEATSIISTFDTANASTVGAEKAIDHCKNLAYFLWCAEKDLIPVLECTPDSQDNELQLWSNKRHSSCILSMIPPGLPPQAATGIVNGSQGTDSGLAFQDLATSINRQVDFFTQMKQDRSDEKDEKKNKFEDLFDSTQRLILNAASQTMETPSPSPPETCIEFYKKKSVSKAKDFLENKLNDLFSCDVDVIMGLVTALFTGFFLWSHENSPGNFSFFLVPRKRPLSGNSMQIASILQMKQSHGKGWDEKDLTDALKQGVQVPENHGDALDQFKNLWGLSSFFFGAKSLLPKRLSEFYEFFSANKLALEGKHLSDNDYLAKVAFAVDTRVFRWLQQCSLKEDRDSIDDSIIDFSDLMKSILLNSFSQDLPPTFHTFENDTEEEVKEPRSKKQRRKSIENGDQSNRRVENHNTLTEWALRDDESYSAVFAGKHLHERPKLNGRPMCQRWHTHKYCFKDCQNKVTHVKGSDVPEAEKRAYTAYCKKCRSE